MKKLLSFLKVYGLAAAIICVWWILAFHETTHHQKKQNLNFKETLAGTIQPTTPQPPISEINRDSLQKALAGDFSLMKKLIVEWDIDAELLKITGTPKIKRLSHNDFICSQLLARILSNSEEIYQGSLSKDSLSLITLPDYVIDDLGTKFNTEKPFKQLLPQTYTAASFLLALVSPSQITALPKNLRESTELYPTSLTDKIVLDIDRYNSEKLFKKRPEIAFVARYSNPSTLTALADQDIAIYMMRNLNTLNDIGEEIVAIGSIINRPLESRLMNYFLIAATYALDNQLAVLTKHLHDTGKPSPRILYINDYYHFSVPTSNTLTGDILKKIQGWDVSLGYAKTISDNNCWSLPISKEQIAQLNPTCLFVTSENCEHTRKKILDDPAFDEVKAVQTNHVYVLKESIQKSNCQFILLAYYDLLDALKRALK